jgi:hypothetical protein
MKIEQLKKKYSDADLQQTKQLLEDFAKCYETEMPTAINCIDCLRQAKDELPNTMDDITLKGIFIT